MCLWPLLVSRGKRETDDDLTAAVVCTGIMCTAVVCTRIIFAGCVEKVSSQPSFVSVDAVAAPLDSFVVRRTP